MRFLKVRTVRVPSHFRSNELYSPNKLKRSSNWTCISILIGFILFVFLGIKNTPTSFNENSKISPIDRNFAEDRAITIRHIHCIYENCKFALLKNGAVNISRYFHH